MEWMFKYVCYYNYHDCLSFLNMCQTVPTLMLWPRPFIFFIFITVRQSYRTWIPSLFSSIPCQGVYDYRPHCLKQTFWRLRWGFSTGGWFDLWSWIVHLWADDQGVFLMACAIAKPAHADHWVVSDTLSTPNRNYGPLWMLVTKFLCLLFAI